MTFSSSNHGAFIGSAAHDLPTPSLIVKKSAVEENIASIHREVDVLGIGFRPRLETLKCLGLMRLMLANGKYRSVICSNTVELEGLLSLAKEGLVDEIVWGLPVAPSKLPTLSASRSLVRIVLKVDSEEHIKFLEQFQGSDPSALPAPWPVFINVDVGCRQASVPVFSEGLDSVVRRAAKSTAVDVLGFYADGRYSYDPIANLPIQDNLPGYIEGLFEAAALLETDRKVIISIEAAPTAFSLTLKDKAPANVDVQLYAGNYSSENLPHVSTGLMTPFHRALRVGVEVCSVSLETNVGLSDGGRIAYKEVNSVPSWSITTLSRENGLIGYMDPIGDAAWDGMRDVAEVFKVGEKVLFDVTEAGIAVSEHRVCYVVGDDDVVVDAWVLWN